jgi:hypothetical protein
MDGSGNEPAIITLRETEHLQRNSTTMFNKTEEFALYETAL